MKMTIEDNGDLVFKDPMVGTYIVALVLIFVNLFAVIYYVIDSSSMNNGAKFMLSISVISLLLLIYGIKQRVGSSCRFSAADKVFYYEISDYLRFHKGELLIEHIKEFYVDEDSIENEFKNSLFRLTVKNRGEKIPLYIGYFNKEKHQEITDEINAWLKLNSLSEIVQV